MSGDYLLCPSKIFRKHDVWFFSPYPRKLCWSRVGKNGVYIVQRIQQELFCHSRNCPRTFSKSFITELANVSHEMLLFVSNCGAHACHSDFAWRGALNTTKLKTALNLWNNCGGYTAVNLEKIHEDSVRWTKIKRNKQACLERCFGITSRSHSPQIPLGAVVK